MLVSISVQRGEKPLWASLLCNILQYKFMTSELPKTPWHTAWCPRMYDAPNKQNSNTWMLHIYIILVQGALFPH